MYLRRNTAVKYCIASIFGAVLYAEFVVYYMQSFYWKDLECQDTTCTKILFIADPQIQGDEAVPAPLNYIFNWDSDRYLRLTFMTVLRHFKPDVLVYLGDLMDEGSIATMPQFHNYVKRLSNIFDVHYPVVQVWIPGDNDIGGENEAIKWDKVEAFNSVFSQPEVVQFRNISFYKINAITHSFLKLPEAVEDTNLKIVVSHYPLLMRHAFTRELKAKVRPNIFFCAHDHDSKYVQQTKNLGTNYVRFYDNRVLDFLFDGEDLFEIFVPTCSYRMGTSNIGYGAALLYNNNQRMKYTVFWSPGRFPYLFFYLIILTLFIIYGCVCCVLKLCIYCQRYRAKDRKIPFYVKL